MLVLARISSPGGYVLIASVVSFSTLFGAILSLGLPIFVLSNPTPAQIKRARVSISSALYIFGLPTILTGVVHFSKVHDVKLALPLVVAEFMIAMPIQFQMRNLLALGETRSLSLLTISTTTLRLVMLIGAEITKNHTIFYAVYALVVLAIAKKYISSPLEIWKNRADVIKPFRESAYMGLSSMLMTGLDNVPTLVAASLLAPSEAVTFTLALRATAVVSIPGQALATVLLTRLSPGDIRSPKNATIIGSLVAVLGTVLILLVIRSTNLLPSYQNALFYYIILFSPLAWFRCASINFGNTLFRTGQAQQRSLISSAGLVGLLLYFCLISRLTNVNTAVLMILGCVISESSIAFTIYLQSRRSLRKYAQTSNKIDFSD